MNQLVTLILILHNRHKNLDRLLDYYQHCSFPILVADSSDVKHHFTTNAVHHTHLYMPKVTFTYKIEAALAQVTTPYVVMCADDDFIIPESILASVEFLENNTDYAIAQGHCICYIKESICQEEVDFRAIYLNHNYDVEQEEPLVRLKQMFNNYRSVLYAIHRTVILKNAFTGAGKVISNLFLNEYLTALLPISCGKYKEMDLLYQVREFARDSDDKTAFNIDTMVTDQQSHNSFEQFKAFVSDGISAVTQSGNVLVRQLIEDILNNFAAVLQRNQISKQTLKMKIGRIAEHIPLIGKQLILLNRSMENRMRLKQDVKTPTDHYNLDVIALTLKKHSC